MAPNRRKGAGKAAVAAASRRQWKVGDLVLAKVKGFPAWPATVSEPEKWGYSADWKKVLVYFFGTQQIAFCNPADVEAFTDEKKQSLLVKLQGKGADFVRAVQEIIDCHEKLKECDNSNDIISGDDVARANGGSVVDSSTNFGPKDESDAPVANNGNLLSNNSLSSRGTSEPVRPVKFASASAQGSSSPDKLAMQEEPTDVAVTDQRFPVSTSSRKRSGGSRLKSSVIRRNVPVVQRSRSSSRVESRRLQHLSLPFKVGDNHMPEESLKRNKRSRKSPNASDCDDATSEALISNVSIEDNASEIATADSDTYSLNECSTIDSECKFEHSETAVECLERDVELGKGLDLHIKAIVIKKKRKPSRKRVVNGASDDNCVQDKEEVLEAVVDDSNQCSQNDFEKRMEKCPKEDGDEHLPLVKRARVRMSKLSSSEEFERHSDAEEQNLKEENADLAGKVSNNSSCADDSSDRGLLKGSGAFDCSSPSKVCTQFSGNRSQLCTFKKDQAFCCSVDGEAVLPPSKRLHRALEAMSANVAEEDQAAVETAISRRTSIKGCFLTSTCSSSPLPMENKKINDLGPHSGISFHNNPFQVEQQGFSTSLDQTSEENGKAILKDDLGYQGDQNPKIQRHDSQDDSLLDAGDHVDPPEQFDSQLGCHSDGTLVLINSVKKESPSGEQASKRSEDGTTDELLPLKNERNGNDTVSSIIKSGNPDEPFEPSEDDMMVCGLVSDANGNAELSHQSGSNVVKCVTDKDNLRITKSLKSVFSNDCEENSALNVKDINGRQFLNDQTSTSVYHVVEKDASEIRSSVSVAGTRNSLVQASPPHTSVGHISTSDSCSLIQNSSSCSPDTNLTHKKSLGDLVEGTKLDSAAIPKLKPKDAGAYVALSSFETMLGNLTRTKDSIGRATRVAIDCAKFGLGPKVVDVLTRTLDTESSLHKKLDLFFLIDSITQSSQNLKGNVAGIYPPAIQSVLSRLLSAVAPPGITAQENRKQCIKVLRLWSQRGVLPESIICHHMRELEALCGSSSVGVYSRRSSRTERSLDDPLREMGGMFVDEYGSNSSLRMPGFCMPQMRKDEDVGSDSDGGSFEAVTPEHESQACEELEIAPVVEKRRHILEDVDGELEMEDVAPREAEMSSCSSIVVNATESLHDKFERKFPLPMAPPLPLDVAPSSPPLPSSPPPQPPPLPPPFTRNDSCATDFGLEHYIVANNIQENSIQSVTQPSNLPGINQRASDAAHYPASECRDLQMQMPESTTRSFSNFSGRALNDAPRDDATTLHNKGYSLRPPYPPPQDQFTYVHGDHRMKPRWDGPPASYSSRFRFGEDMDGENYYDNHERMSPYSYEQHENWRIPRPLYGSRYHDRGRASYGPASCGGAPCEPARLHSQRWRFPSRDMNSRNSVPYRQPYEGPMRVSSRGPSFWRPR